MKKFWETSEFWVSMATSIGGMLVMTGAITADQADQIKNAVQQIIGGILGLVPVIAYVKTRTDLKRDIVANMPSAGWQRDAVTGDTVNVLSADSKQAAYTKALRDAGV
jgi:hypothetical protein